MALRAGCVYANALLGAGRSAGAYGAQGRQSTAAVGGVMSSISRRAYHEKVINHYENPRNVGSFDRNDPNVGTGLVGAPACGDVMKLQIRVGDDGTIVESRFKTFGCGSAIASSSLATEMVKGMNMEQAVGIKNADIAKELSLPPVKLHCSMLAEDAIRAAVKDIQQKRLSKQDSALKASEEQVG